MMLALTSLVLDNCHVLTRTSCFYAVVPLFRYAYFVLVATAHHLVVFIKLNCAQHPAKRPGDVRGKRRPASS